MGQLECVLLELGVCHIVCRGGWVRVVVDSGGCGFDGVPGSVPGLSGLGSSSARLGVYFGCCCCRLGGRAARNMSETCSVSSSSRSGSYK